MQSSYQQSWRETCIDDVEPPPYPKRLHKHRVYERCLREKKTFPRVLPTLGAVLQVVVSVFEACLEVSHAPKHSKVKTWQDYLVTNKFYCWLINFSLHH